MTLKGKKVGFDTGAGYAKLHYIKKPIKIFRGCMGAGKTYATLHALSENTQTIFIAERLEAVSSAIRDCKHMIEVEAKPTKTDHLKELLLSGKSVVCTHSLFRLLKSDIIAIIEDRGIELIIDELLESTVEVRGTMQDEEGCCISSGLRAMLHASNAIGIEEDTGRVYWNSSFPSPVGCGGTLEDIYHWCQAGVLFWYNTRVEDLSGFVVTAFPFRLLEAFKSVSMLCYGFDGLPMQAYLDLFEIPYIYDNRFLDGESEHLSNLKLKVNFLKDTVIHKTIDKISKRSFQGKELTFSLTCWQNMKYEDVREIGAKMDGYLRSNKITGSKALWTVYKDFRDEVAKGFKKEFLNKYGEDNISEARKGTCKTFASWNLKGTNEYKDRELMMLMVSPNIHPDLFSFFRSRGIELDKDSYKLEMTRQWIMRGCARDKSSDRIMDVLVASKEVQRLLEKWINGELINSN